MGKLALLFVKGCALCKEVLKCTPTNSKNVKIPNHTLLSMFYSVYRKKTLENSEVMERKDIWDSIS